VNAPALLRGVDRAAFAVALVTRLRRAGVAVSASGPASFVAALGVMSPSTRGELYWCGRLTLVNRSEDLPGFDAVFDTVVGDAVLGLDPVGRKATSAGEAAAEQNRAATGPALEGAGLPWVSRSASAVATQHHSPEADVAFPDLLPSRLAARSDDAFDTFAADDVRLIGRWLEWTVPRWPRRRTLRHEPSRRGRRIDLRATMRGSRATGWEVLRLARARRRQRARRVVFVCDVSRSMQPYVAIYLHLMRALAVRRPTMRPEVFAFSTSLTRLTAVLSHRTAEVALDRANASVGDRYGGTRLGASLAALLAGVHGYALRGAVVVIASDGWDADDPEVTRRAMVRLRTRAHSVVWLNPRAAARDYRPLAGSMAAAVPYCDLILPAHSLDAIRGLFDELTRLASPA
jgi:uncharacterized protein with von Willebrand factor type A (vWA) domain